MREEKKKDRWGERISVERGGGGRGWRGGRGAGRRKGDGRGREGGGCREERRAGDCP